MFCLCREEFQLGRNNRRQISCKLVELVEVKLVLRKCFSVTFCIYKEERTRPVSNILQLEHCSLFYIRLQPNAKGSGFLTVVQRTYTLLKQIQRLYLEGKKECAPLKDWRLIKGFGEESSSYRIKCTTEPSKNFFRTEVSSKTPNSWEINGGGGGQRLTFIGHSVSSCSDKTLSTGLCIWLHWSSGFHFLSTNQLTGLTSEESQFLNSPARRMKLM